MSKTTFKMSALALLCLMTYGNAQQQQGNSNKGNAGINIVQPRATMDVQPHADNAQSTATSNEGIIAPKLSKVRIANIAAPEEATLVYATDATYTPGTNATVNNRVAKITEKGYYYYNGDEWVKAGPQLWQKQANKDIVLVDNDIQNTVKYTEKGGFVNVPKKQRLINTWNPTNNTIVSFTNLNTRNLINSNNINVQFADKISETYIHPFFKEKQLSYNLFVADDNSNTSSPIDIFLLQKNHLITNQSFTKNMSALYSSVNLAQHYGAGNVDLLLGASNTAELYNGSAERLVGAYNEVTSTVSSTLNTMEGSFNFITPRGSGKIINANANRNEFNITGVSNNTITNVVLTRNSSVITDKFTGKIENLIGVHTDFFTDSGVTSIKNMYGLKIGDVNRGAEINRAIHTEAGQIRFGDLKHSITTNIASTGDRPVFVTADGILKVGNASTALSRAIWKTDGNHVKLALTANGSDRVDNIIKINDVGQVFASSFRSYNNINIFPDYVFQKYYTGTSSIKADYNFKTLSQVEDFIKTHGHLPGYKSSETVKNQGYVDLMETQLTNVEKIEELYLHSIEQDRSLKAKEAKIKELEAKNATLESRIERLEKLIQ